MGLLSPHFSTVLLLQSAVAGTLSALRCEARLSVYSLRSAISLAPPGIRLRVVDGQAKQEDEGEVSAA